MTNPRAIFNDELPWYLKCAGTEAELAAIDEAENWLIGTGKHPTVACVVDGIVVVPLLFSDHVLTYPEFKELDD